VEIAYTVNGAAKTAKKRIGDYWKRSTGSFCFEPGKAYEFNIVIGDALQAVTVDVNSVNDFTQPGINVQRAWKIGDVYPFMTGPGGEVCKVSDTDEKDQPIEIVYEVPKTTLSPQEQLLKNLLEIASQGWGGASAGNGLISQFIAAGGSFLATDGKTYTWPPVTHGGTNGWRQGSATWYDTAQPWPQFTDDQGGSQEIRTWIIYDDGRVACGYNVAAIFIDISGNMFMEQVFIRIN
jgi:hypothetical protein